VQAQDVIALEAQHVVQVYRRARSCSRTGAACSSTTPMGASTSTSSQASASPSLGHAHPELARIVSEQASTLLHCSNLFYHPFQGPLAARLSALSGLERVFFCNSGTEAVEACLKFARRYWFTAGERARTRVVALHGAFHGRTLGSLSVTADPHYRDPFAPLLADVTFVPPNDADALRAAVTDQTGAVVLEGIQGEGGVRPLTREFAAAVQDACERTGALLVCDEVQCGLGRTGRPFYYPALGLCPSLVAIGKALGAGIPIGAALVARSVAERISPGDHGSTYGGNLLACRAGLFLLDQLTTGGLMAHVARVGAHLERRLRDLAAPARHRHRRARRGAHARARARSAAADVVDAARARGLLVNATAKTVVRLLPPLVITEPEVDRAIDLLDGAMADVEGARS
jgi:acetylornithine/N-succinyldiaminopimelate aminotransferase